MRTDLDDYMTNEYHFIFSDSYYKPLKCLLILKRQISKNKILSKYACFMTTDLICIIMMHLCFLYFVVITTTTKTCLIRFFMTK